MDYKRPPEDLDLEEKARKYPFLFAAAQQGDEHAAWQLGMGPHPFSQLLKGLAMPIKKLIVKEFEATGKEPKAKQGFRFSYFHDPETGKWYRPKPTFEVTGENLEELFEEVEE